ncbi:MAG: L,D-transpeptidase family protein [Magnetococcales bacterium]|nr:L,D-transpeptidase family protein [Magnetococcales bacterium]
MTMPIQRILQTHRALPLLLTLALSLSGCVNLGYSKRSAGQYYDVSFESDENLPVETRNARRALNRDLALDKNPPKVQQVVERYDESVRTRLKRDFKLAGLPYPSARLALLGFKKERRLELWGADGDGPMKYIKKYPFTAFSGDLGPKRRQGDKQIPEGIYRITFLNPNSAYHLSMKLDYPNAFDRAMADLERRGHLGGDIFIHGDSESVGCIALGDRAIEELFVLTAWAGMENVQVIVAPYDLRRDKEIRAQDHIPWTRELYARLQDSLASFRE